MASVPPLRLLLPLQVRSLGGPLPAPGPRHPVARQEVEQRLPLVLAADQTNTVVGSPILVGVNPIGVAVTPDGSKVYITHNSIDGTVSVINTATNTVVGSPIRVGHFPNTFGLFIQPARTFAGTPGRADCQGKSVTALARHYGGLTAAAIARGYKNVAELQGAIRTYCNG